MAATLAIASELDTAGAVQVAAPHENQYSDNVRRIEGILMNLRESGNSGNFLGEDILSERERNELYEVGIRSRHALVTEIEEAYDARRLAKEIEIAAPRLVDLWRLAQLQQVHGVGDSTAKLLLGAGVRSVADLSRRNPDRLHEELKRVNRQNRVLSMSPRKRDILRWIRRAKRLIKFRRAE